jgi:hypothetical protein
MNYLLKSFLIAISAILLSTSSLFAQGQIYDVVSIGQGYANQSFYSMANGEVSTVTNTDWDLAFQIAGFQASILINGKNNVKLYRSGKDVNAWSNITPNDTVGVLNPSNELNNQDTSWWSGAFNITADLSNQFDLGWGVYDFATHAVTGDSIHFIKLSNGSVKKIWIQQLANGIYYFAHANVDGSNEVNATLSKSAFSGKNFGYYSILNNTTIDREPLKSTWDLTFMQYVTTVPFTYKVSGVLSNDSVTVAKAYPVDVTNVNYWVQSYSKYINTIGFNWKTFDLNSNQWLIEDSLVYFVNARPGVLWKMVFTGFGGASTGDFEFYKEEVSATGVAENGGQPALLSVYPNPAKDMVKMTVYINKAESGNSATIFDINGRVVKQMSLEDLEGLNEVTLNTTELSSGVYSVQVIADGAINTSRLIIN